MFSARTAWDRTENELARLVAEARASGRRLVDLTESNPTRCNIVDLAPAIAELGHPRGAVYEPWSLGHPVAREAVAGHYRAKGYDIDSDHIVITASTSESYGFLFHLLGDVGDNVLVPQPSYPLFTWLATLGGVRLAPYRLDRNEDWRIDFDDLERSIDERTRAIVLVHPNNPTGSFIRREEAEQLEHIAKTHGLALVVDEVFADHGFSDLPADRLPSFVERDGALTFVLGGLSKALLLPQCKLGWIVVDGPPHLVAEALSRLELIADTFLSVSTPVQLALPALLERHSETVARTLARTEGNLRALDEALATLGPESPLRRLPVDGGWYVTLEVPRVHDEDGWVELLLEEEGLHVHPGYFFDFDRDGFLVLSLLPEPEIFAEAVVRLVRRIAREAE